MKKLFAILATGLLLAGPARATEVDERRSAYQSPGSRMGRTAHGCRRYVEAECASREPCEGHDVRPSQSRTGDGYRFEARARRSETPPYRAAIGTGLIVRSDRCRSNTEAYVEPGALERTFEKVRRNGGDVKYVATDEPYFYGHRYFGPTACHESVEAIAKAVAERVRLVREYFPSAEIGESEVLDQSRPGS
jgi:hypothetical protein